MCHLYYLLLEQADEGRGKWTTSQLTDEWEGSEQSEKVKVKRSRRQRWKPGGRLVPGELICHLSSPVSPKHPLPFLVLLSVTGY